MEPRAGPREMRTSKARSEHSVGFACHRRWGRIRQAVYSRLAVKHPRWEPYAGKPHVPALCGGRIVICVPTAIKTFPGRACRTADPSAALRRKTFPRKVRGTADPSASLGMTKGRATLPWRAVAGQKVFFISLGGPAAKPHAHLPLGMTKGRVVLPSGPTARWAGRFRQSERDSLLVERTAGPSTALRSGRDGNSYFGRAAGAQEKLSSQ